MKTTQFAPSQLALRARALMAPLFFLAAMFLAADSARGTAISKNDFGLGGTPLTAPYPNANSNFFRWQQNQISYAFSPNFVTYYGAPGQTRVTTAFTTWTNSLTANNTTGTDISGAYNVINDIKILGQGANIYDFQSVALHEIGHAIGFDHPDAGSGNGANNYNVAAGDWVNGALPGGSHPVMWHDLATNTTRQSLTLDDVRGSQFLYSQAAAGAGNGAAGGPVFGNNASGLTFNQIAYNAGALPDILIDVAPLAPGNLGVTFLRPGGTFTAVQNFTYKLSTNATFMTIQFPIPEPSSVVLAIFGAAGMAVVVIRRRRAA